MRLQARLVISVTLIFSVLGAITAAVLVHSHHARQFNDEFAGSIRVVQESLLVERSIRREIDLSRYAVEQPLRGREALIQSNIESARAVSAQAIQDAIRLAELDNEIHSKLIGTPFRSVSSNALEGIQAIHGKIIKDITNALKAGTPKQESIRLLEAAEHARFQEVEPLFATILRNEMAELTLDQRELRSSLGQISASAVAALFFALVIALTLIAPIVLQSFRRLDALERSIRCVSTGNFAIHLDESGEDELSEISRAFNRMAQGLTIAHRQIESSNARFRSLLESLRTVVFQTDTEGLCVFLNPAWKDITGHPVESMVGEPLSQFIAEEHRASVSETLNDLATRRLQFASLTLQVLTAKGANRWMELQARPVMGTHGDVIGVTGTFSDVDERIRTLETLKEQERTLSMQHKLLSTVLDHIPVAIYSKDPRNDLRYTLFNRKAESLFGLRRDFAIGKSPWELHSPERAEAIRRSDMATLEAHSGVETTEWEVYACARRPTRLRVQKYPVYDDHGEPLMLLGIAEDITERMQRRAESEAINEVSHICLHALSLDEIYEKVPYVLNARLGFEKSMISLNYPESREIEVVGSLGMERVLKDRRRLDYEASIAGTAITHASMICIDKPAHPELKRTIAREAGLKCIISVPLIIQEKVIGALNAASSTERLIHESLRNALQVIADTVGQSIHRKQSEAVLVNSARLASLGEMSGGVAHEINNPLAIILAKTSQLKLLVSREPIARDAVLKGLEKIESTGWRISKIVRGMRTFSRDAEGDPFSVVSLKSVIEEALEVCGERFRNNGIDLRLGPQPEGEIECRPTQISQVLLNLLNNAFDAVQERAAAHPSEPRWVEYSAQDNGEYWRILITDSGPGIPPDIAAKIMQPFFTTKGPGKGTGLGLSICRGIVEKHQGRFALDRECSHTRFVIEIPKRQTQIRNTVA